MKNELLKLILFVIIVRNNIKNKVVGFSFHLVIELVRMKIILILFAFILSVAMAAPSFYSSEENFGFGFGRNRGRSSESYSNERFYPGQFGYNQPFSAFPFANR